MSVSIGAEIARTRSRLATATRLGTPEELTEAKRNHAAAKLADVIDKVVAEAPPLTPEQRDRLAGLLRGGGAHV